MKTLLNRIKTDEIGDFLSIFPVVAILGARQVGKTTLAKEITSKLDSDVIYLDLENRVDLAKLNEPELYFARNRNKVIILDEIQLKPHFFQILRSVVDASNTLGQFIILGFASQALLRQSSETLAGRIGYIELSPFLINEVDDENKLWIRGGFPRSYLANSDNSSFVWRDNFLKTFLQRDIPMLGISIPALQLEQFWEMVAHSHGQCFNASAIAQNFGMSVPTVKRYLSILEGTYMIRQLYPYSANVKKRLVKTPKVYIRDSGILHSLLKIKTQESLEGNPIIGASYEGWVIEQICSSLNYAEFLPYFYRTHAGAEIDLLLKTSKELIAVEIKRSLAPKISRGFYETIKLLDIDHSFVIYPGTETYRLKDNIIAISLGNFLKEYTT
jgi:uncharacterized protein